MWRQETPDKVFSGLHLQWAWEREESSQLLEEKRLRRKVRGGEEAESGEEEC